MPKSVHRNRRRDAKALRRARRDDVAGGRSESPARRDSRDQSRLLDRILDTPHLAQVVPRLQPEVLHRVIQTCGLEDCGELVALATPDQLRRVFDLDLWRSDQPGFDEQVDAHRFGVWLEVLMESGATVAAQKLAGVDIELVTAALAQHVLVFDRAAVSSFPALEGEEAALSRRGGGIDCEVGGYLVEAKCTASWDAIVAVLRFLDAEHHDYFNRLMRGCRSLSNSTPELDGFHDLPTDREQDMLDLSFDREQRREKQGYVTPAQARAFLHMARQLQLGDDTAPPRNPVAAAYFRAIEWTAPVDADHKPCPLPATSGSPPAPNDEDSIAAVVDVLLEAGVLTQPPRGLLDGPQGHAPRLARIQAHMQCAHRLDHAAYSTRTGEFAYLANAIVAGCSIQARPFTVREASDAAAAVCNLGLENWPTRWLGEKDLISVFQVGWTVLHADVSIYAADRLIQVLTDLRSNDRQIQAGIDALRIELTRHWHDGAPWRARDALDVIMILDMGAWAALLGLIDECPVIHAAIGAARGSRIRTVSASAFEFIAENRQIASIHEFMESLPQTLRC